MAIDVSIQTQGSIHTTTHKLGNIVWKIHWPWSLLTITLSPLESLGFNSWEVRDQGGERLPMVISLPESIYHVLQDWDNNFNLSFKYYYLIFLLPSVTNISNPCKIKQTQLKSRTAGPTKLRNDTNFVLPSRTCPSNPRKMRNLQC